MARGKKRTTKSTADRKAIACPPDTVSHLRSLADNARQAQAIWTVAVHAARTALQVPADWQFNGTEFVAPTGTDSTR